MNKNILITGAKGFIGQHLVLNLVKNKRKIIQIARNYGDLSKEKTWNKMPKANIVVHLASKTFIPDSWNNPLEFFNTNINSTILALEYCVKRKAKLILMSSYLYGNTKKIPTNEKVQVNIDNPYHLSKKICEDICKIYSKKYNLKITILRLFNTYGKMQKNSFLIPSIIHQIKNKKIIKVDNLSTKRDFLYIDDLIEAIVKSISLDKKFTILNIGSGKSYSVKEIVKIMQKIMKSNLKVKGKSPRPHEIFNTLADIKKAKKNLNWEPKWSLKQGLKNFIS